MAQSWYKKRTLHVGRSWRSTLLRARVITTGNKQLHHRRKALPSRASDLPCE